MVFIYGVRFFVCVSVNWIVVFLRVRISSVVRGIEVVLGVGVIGCSICVVYVGRWVVGLRSGWIGGVVMINGVYVFCCFIC